MPRKIKKKAGGPRSRNKAPAMKNAAPASAALAVTSGLRSIFNVSHSKRGQTDVIRVHVRDQLAHAPSTGTSSNVQADAIPFTLASNSPYLSKLGQILPKLQGFAKVAGRFQVLSARLHHQSLSPATTHVSVGMAIVPGFRASVGNLPEIASFAHSVVLPAWQNGSTSNWVNAEQRWFATGDELQSSLAPSVPFTILRVYDANSSVTPVYNAGLLWLEAVIEFIDLQPVPQASVDLKVGSPPTGIQTVTGGAAAGTNAIGYGAAKAMEGLFNWYFDTPTTYSSSGSLISSKKPGTSVLADAGSLEWWSELVLGAATISKTQSRDELKSIDLTPDEESPEVVVESDRTFPRPWTAPHRKKVICAFRNLKEAYAARSSGFDPERVAQLHSNAAGDLTVSLYAQPLSAYTDVVQLYSAVHSAGAGIVTAIDNHFFDLEVPAKLILFCTPTGVENRTVSADSSMSLDVVVAP